MGQTTLYLYDALGRQTGSMDPRGALTSFTYDAVGNLKTLTDPNANTTAWAYDRLDRATSETNALGATRTYGYDLVGNLTSAVDRLGRLTTYSYDAMNRLTQEVWKASTAGGAATVNTVNYAHDKAGQLLSAADGASSYAYTYDGLGRVVTTSNAGTPGAPTVVLTSGYDDAGNRTSLAASIGGVADFKNAYTYDALNRVTRVTQQSQTGGAAVDAKRVDFAYNALGQFTSIARYSDLAGANEVVATTYTYDDLARLESLTHKHGSDTRASYGYTYDDASRITRIVSSMDGTTDYGYDDAGQLIEADNGGAIPDEAYDWDANGNPDSATAPDVVVGANNQLLNDGKYAYVYDAEGNRIRRTELATGVYEEYSWDHRNRLTSVVKKSAAGVVILSSVYTYDVYDRRIAKTVDADGAGSGVAWTEKFVYDGSEIVLAFQDPDAGGAAPTTLSNRYLYGPAVDQILADEQLSAGVFQRTLWPLTDHLGTVRDIADDSGAAVNHLTYDSFGELLGQTAAAYSTRYFYTGQERDVETGLQLHWHRYYDPATQRWVSEDPIGFAAGDQNVTRYVGSSPLTKTDSNGLEDRETIEVPVNVLIWSMAKGGPTQQAVAKLAEADIKKANTYYAPHGIRFVPYHGGTRDMIGFCSKPTTEAVLTRQFLKFNGKKRVEYNFDRHSDYPTTDKEALAGLPEALRFNPKEVDKERFVNIPSPQAQTLARATEFEDFNNTPKGIFVHYVNDVMDAQAVTMSKLRYPDLPYPMVVVDPNDRASLADDHTLTHELGHALGLQHYEEGVTNLMIPGNKRPKGPFGPNGETRTKCGTQIEDWQVARARYVAEQIRDAAGP